MNPDPTNRQVQLFVSFVDEKDDLSGSYEGLRSFADVKALLGQVSTHQGLRALNDAVDERFLRDRQQLTMTNADWEQWTVLVARKAAQLDA